MPSGIIAARRDITVFQRRGDQSHGRQRSWSLAFNASFSAFAIFSRIFDTPFQNDMHRLCAIGRAFYATLDNPASLGVERLTI